MVFSMLNFLLKKRLFPVIVSLFFLFTACEEDSVSVFFTVTCTGGVNPGEFTGYYTLDGKEIVPFDDTASGIVQNDTYTYSFISDDLTDFSSLDIYARRKYYDGDLIIRVYEDGEKVDSETLSADEDEEDSSTDYVILTYDYPSDDESDDSSDTTTDDDDDDDDDDE